MTEEQTTDLLAVLNKIASSLIEIEGAISVLAYDSLSRHERIASAALTGIMANADLNDEDAAELSIKIAKLIVEKSDG